jgi:chromosome partitioning protein
MADQILLASKPRSPAIAKPKLVFVSSPKGGVGKTTFALHLLVRAAQSGFRVRGIDLDPQRSLTNWAKRRPTSQIVPVQVVPGDLANWRAVLETQADVDVVVIDSPPGIQHSISAMVRLAETANIVLIPTGPGNIDLDAAIMWMASLGDDKSKMAFCLNRVNRRTKSFEVAQRRLLAHGPLCPIEVATLDDIQTLPGMGYSTLDVERGKGAEKFESLWDFVKLEVDL